MTRRIFGQLRRDFLLYGLLFGVSQLFNLALLPILTRSLSIEEFGAVDLLAMVVSLTSAAISLSLPSALARYFEATPPRELGSVATALLATVALSGILLAPLLAMVTPELSILLFSSEEYVPLLHLATGIAFLQALSSIPEMLLRLRRRIPLFAAIQMAFSIAYLVLVPVLVLGFDRGIRGVFEAQLFARFLSLVLNLALAGQPLAINPGFRYLRRSMRFSLPQMPAHLLGWASPQLNRILLLSLGGITPVAIYGVAARLARLSSAAGTVFGNAWQPFAMLLIDDVGRNETYSRAFNFYAVGMAALGIVVTAVARELLSFLAPHSYAEAVYAIPWLIGGQAVRQSAMFTRLGVLIGERTALLSLATTLGLLVNLLLGLLLIPPLGVAGAAIAFFISGVLQTSALAWLAERVSDVRFDGYFLYRLLTLYCLSTTSFLLLLAEFPSTVSLFLRTVVLGVSIAMIVRWTRKLLNGKPRLSPQRSGPHE